MDHAEAVNSQAVERYLLGQMADSETELFEMHFFECTECTEEIESGTLLAENVRAVFTHRLAKSWAAAVLAVITVYQSGLVVPALRQEIAHAGAPQALFAFTIRSASRGEDNPIKVPAGVRSFALQVDLTDASFPSYRCDLSGGSTT